MAVLTGANGELRYQGVKVAKTRDWTLNVSRDALEDTCVGQEDRSYVKGLRSASGSATVLYDPSEDNSLLNSIFDNSASDNLEFVFNESAGSRFKCTGFLTAISPSVAVGSVQAVPCSFQISGPVDGRY